MEKRENKMEIRKIKEDKQRTIYESVFMYSQSILGMTGEKTIIIYNKNSNNVFLRAEYLYKDGTVKNTAVCITDELLDFITELKRKNGNEGKLCLI